MRKIVYLDYYALNPGDIDFTALHSLGDVELFDRTVTFEDTVKRLSDCEIAIVNKVKLTDKVFDLCPKLKFVAVTATGYDIVDIKAAKERGILVANVPAYSTPSVAQHIFALLLELAVRTGDHSKSVKNGDWSKCPDYTYHISHLTELSGKTMGFIGMGAIGSAAAKIAQAFGMKAVCYHSRSEVEGVEHLDLDTLLKVSDVISLCCPLTPETKEIISKDTLNKMRDGVIIINTSRGGLINEEDLALAIKSGKVRGAGLDVLKTEPPINSSPLIDLDEVIVTPHIAWAPKESRERLLNVAIENIKAYIDGSAQNIVNK